MAAGPAEPFDAESCAAVSGLEEEEEEDCCQEDGDGDEHPGFGCCFVFWIAEDVAAFVAPLGEVVDVGAAVWAGVGVFAEAFEVLLGGAFVHGGEGTG